MISHLTGKVLMRGDKFIALDVNGVGYKIFVMPDTLKEARKNPDGFSVWTHLHVRETALELYGFLQYAELEFFEMLIQISGIGPKSGLGVLAVAPLDTLKRAISSGDTSYLTKVSGIGRKIAEKIVLELREKMGGLDLGETGNAMLKEEGDVLDALQSLGYSLSEAREAQREDKGGAEGGGEEIERMKNFEEEISANKEKIIGDFLDKYFSPETAKNDETRSEPVEIEREELEKIIEAGEGVENLLNRIKEKGYLLSGSPKNIDKLKAKQPGNIKSRKDDLRKAIYATNIPSIAIFHAILRPRKKERVYYAGWKVVKNPDGEIAVKFDASQSAIDGMADGYVYTIRKNDFTQCDGNSSQFFKEGDYTPIHKIPVSKNDFKRALKIAKDEDILRKVNKGRLL